MPESLFVSPEVSAAVAGSRVSGSAGGGFSGVSIDTRTLRPGDLYVAIIGKRFDGNDFISQAFERGAAGAVVSRWPLAGEAGFSDRPVWKVEDTQAALGRLASFHRERFKIPVIAVTGSAGKTTTKEMLHRALFSPREVLATEGTQNNLIGVPLTLFKLGSSHRAAVVEMGTNRWGEIGALTKIAKPTVGVITNIGQAHLETFGDLQGVLRAKGEMWEAMDSRGTLVLNGDDPLLAVAGKQLPHKVVWFSATEHGGSANNFGGGSRIEIPIRVSEIVQEPWGTTCLVNGRWRMRLAVPGRHNLMNALAALTCAAVLGEDVSASVERLVTFEAIQGRMAAVEMDGCFVIDDSYNANPTSLKAALDVLRRAECRGRRIAVIGDMLELGPRADLFHEEAGRWVVESRVDFLVTVGGLSRRLAESAQKEGLSSEAVRSFDRPDEAREFFSGLIRPGDTVLLKGSRGMQMERVLPCSTTSSIH